MLLWPAVDFHCANHHHYGSYCKCDSCLGHSRMGNVASRLTIAASLTFTYNIGNTSYFPAAICFMRFRALPARNHSICCSFIVWFREILSTLPLECLISAFTGCKTKRKHSHYLLLIILEPGSFENTDMHVQS